MRDALHRYKAEHGYKVGRLADEICRSDPLGRTMSYKTLGRFLAKAKDTEPINVSICYEFVKNLPYFNEQVSIAQLGEALSNFLAGDRSDRSFWEAAGRRYFELSYDPAVVKGDPQHATGKTEPNDTLFSTLMIEPVVDQSHFRMIEIVFNLLEEPDNLSYPRYRHEGVAKVIETSCLVSIVRDKLTRRPRMATWVAEQEDGEASVQLDAVSFFQLAGQERPFTASARLNARSVDFTPEEAAALFHQFEIIG